MQYYPHGSVREYISSHKITEGVIRDIICYVLLGLDHLHKSNIAHRVREEGVLDEIGHKTR